MKIRIFNIQWETDGEKVDLPTEIESEVEAIDEDAISEWLSDTYGWHHNGFEFEVI